MLDLCRYSSASSQPVLEQECSASLSKGLAAYNERDFDAAQTAFNQVGDLVQQQQEASLNLRVLEAAASVNLANTLREKYHSKIASAFAESDDETEALAKETDSCYRQALLNIQNTFGSEHLRVSRTHREYALFLEMAGEYATMEKVLREHALPIHVRNAQLASADEEDGLAKQEVVSRVLERMDMVLLLARCCHVQGKEERRDHLENTLSKCINLIEVTDRASLLKAIPIITQYKSLKGQNLDKEDDSSRLGFVLNEIAKSGIGSKNE